VVEAGEADELDELGVVVGGAAAHRRPMDDRLAVGGGKASERQQRRSGLSEALEQRRMVRDRAKQAERLGLQRAHQAAQAFGDLGLVGRCQRSQSGCHVAMIMLRNSKR
jgi:hypothetical protein